MERIEEMKNTQKKILANVDKFTYAKLKANCAYLDIPIGDAVGHALIRETKYLDKKVKELLKRS